MRLRWLRSGSGSLIQLTNYIALDNEEAAKRVRRRVRQSVLRLVDFPLSGRMGKQENTRELIVPDLPYVIIYRVLEDEVQILRVHHTATDWVGRRH